MYQNLVKILQYTEYTQDSQYLKVCQKYLGFWTRQNIKGLGLKVLNFNNPKYSVYKINKLIHFVFTSHCTWWSEKFSASIMDGNIIGKIFFPLSW
jgi:hypothetical protein